MGSIDTGILVSKLVYHDDVRKHGSGAAGMTNMLRTFGKRAAAMTAAGDVLKGVLAVCIGRWLFTFLSGELFSQYVGVYLAAILAVVGHLKPIYFGFKGGKGVLVAGGAILAVQPVLFPCLFVIFLICLIPTGMVSLGSIVMAACYPFLTLGYGLLTGLTGRDLAVTTIGAAIMAVMVLYMHRSNFQRIREGKRRGPFCGQGPGEEQDDGRTAKTDAAAPDRTGVRRELSAHCGRRYARPPLAPLLRDVLRRDRGLQLHGGKRHL